MKTLFQSKVFRRLFFTYIVVITTCFTAYTLFMIYENHQINRMTLKRESEVKLAEVESVIDQRFFNAQNIVQNLSYSTVLKQLYLSNILGTSMDSYALYSIQSELKNTIASGGLSIYKTIIFLNNSDKAYSSGGIIKLSDSFEQGNTEYPYLCVNTLNGAFGFESDRYSFQKECLLYCDAYTYQNGSEIGTICILFDLEDLEDDLREVLGEDYSGSISYKDTEIYALGEASSRVYSVESTRCADVVYRLYVMDSVTTGENAPFVVMLGMMILISAAFVGVAFWQSRRYYMPIDRLEQMVREKDAQKDETSDGEMRTDPGDEMDDIIVGIRELIGEKNSYRERMMTIAPYAKSGMLHSMIAGNLDQENIRVFSEENYIDLVKPYYIVSVADLTYPTKADGDDRRQHIKQVFRMMEENFTTDEMRLVCCFRDAYQVFCIVNSESDEIEDELFYRLHRFLCTALESEQCLVTMGVDRLRGDINELREACQGAVTALDGILTDGRGEVYFQEENHGKAGDYYFPAHFQEKLQKYLKKDQKEELRELLDEIYRKNWEMAGNLEMYRSLIDELHLSIIKTLREITDLNTTHISVERYRGLSTLQEVFDYYTAALCSIADSLREQRMQAEADSRLEDDIIQYINDNCYDSELSLYTISDRFKISSKYITLLCKKRTGTTYLQYIQNKRIEHAAQLLREGNHSLSEVAQQCGYSNQLTFRRNFKAIMGVNPSDFV